MAIRTCESPTVVYPDYYQKKSSFSLGMEMEALAWVGSGWGLLSMFNVLYLS